MSIDPQGADVPMCMMEGLQGKEMNESLLSPTELKANQSAKSHMYVHTHLDIYF